MPYMLKQVSGKWHVVNKLTGADKGVSVSKEMATSHMRALYAHESDKRSSHK